MTLFGGVPGPLKKAKKGQKMAIFRVPGGRSPLSATFFLVKKAKNLSLIRGGSQGGVQGGSRGGHF
jgi:hypothetical protein